MKKSLRFFELVKHGWLHPECVSKDIIAQGMSKCSKIGIIEKQYVFFSKNSLKVFKRTKLANFFSSLRLRLSYCLRILKTFKNWVFGKTVGIFFKKCQQFSKDAFWQISCRMRPKRYYCSRTLRKFKFGAFCKLKRVFYGIILDSLQNHYTWQLFCSMLFKHSNGNNDEDFRNDLNFIFFPGETERFFKKKLDFLENC